MADNITLNLGSGGEVLATDDVSGVHYQLVKLISAEADATTGIYSGNGLANQALRVTIASDSTGQVKLAAGTSVVGTVNLGTATTTAASLGKLTDAAATTSDVGIAMLARRAAVATLDNFSDTDGDYEPLTVDSGRLNTSTVGLTAHDNAVAGNPVLIGSEARGTNVGGRVDEGDICRTKTTLEGRLLVADYHPNPLTDNDSQTSAQTNTNLVNAPAAGWHIHVTDIVISVDATQTILFNEDGSGSPVLKIPIIYMAADTTINLHFRTPIRLSDGVNLAYTSTTTAATSILVNYFSAA